MTRITNTILSTSIPNPQYKIYLNGRLTLTLITPNRPSRAYHRNITKNGQGVAVAAMHATAHLFLTCSIFTIMNKVNCEQSCGEKNYIQTLTSTRNSFKP